VFAVATARAQVPNETVLHQFDPSQNDGASPYSGTVLGADGLLYGTTWDGGTNAQGTVFRMARDGGSYTVLHHFGAPREGHSLESSLLLGNDGWLYGTTVSGGTNGYGTVFKMNTSGGGYAVLRGFTNSPDGANPYGGLAQGSDGALYGVTTYGGVTNSGAIFKLNTDGSGYSVLYSFTGNNGDGANPFASMITTGNGVFYGTTLNSGTSEAFGTVFRFSMLPNLGIGMSNAVPVVTLTGFAGQPCQLQVSSNFINWDFLGNVSLTNGTAQFADFAGVGLPARFYRALVQ
jgi:uncharacterized repeat protein (TIGR03803 family)